MPYLVQSETIKINRIAVYAVARIKIESECGVEPD